MCMLYFSTRTLVWRRFWEWLLYYADLYYMALCCVTSPDCGLSAIARPTIRTRPMRTFLSTFSSLNSFVSFFCHVPISPMKGSNAVLTVLRLRSSPLNKISGYLRVTALCIFGEQALGLFLSFWSFSFCILVYHLTPIVFPFFNTVGLWVTIAIVGPCKP